MKLPTLIIYYYYLTGCLYLKNGQFMEVAVKKLQINEGEGELDTSGQDIIIKRFIYEASKRVLISRWSKFVVLTTFIELRNHAKLRSPSHNKTNRGVDE